jgi:hypothetical protein
MRDTKYRGIRIDNKEWVYGYLIGKNVIVGEIVEWDSEYFNTEFWRKVDPETVGQFSGVSDGDTDEELFSGDIIQVCYEGETITCEVLREGPGYLLSSNEFDDGYIWISEIVETLDGKFYIPDSELLGNRWEHPHLLGGAAIKALQGEDTQP